MTSLPRVTVADPLARSGLDLLLQHCEVSVAADAAGLLESIGNSEALIVRSRTHVTAELMSEGTRLQIVGRAGIGVDNIDVRAATERGILVVNAPLGNVRSTAEHTVALIFALARRVTAADRAVRDGTWKAGYEGFQLSGKRLGLVGAGKVGRQVASMAIGIGMEVVAYDPYLDDAAWAQIGLQAVRFDELLETSDVITLHVPLMDETKRLFTARELSRMKAGSYLINCARGGLVDEADLVHALETGQLAGAALDVFEHEPLTNSPLLSAPNLILTPHVAASTREAQTQVSADIAAQIVDFFAGKPVAYPINPEVLHTRASREAVR